MITVKFFQQNEIADEKLKFSVIPAKYQGKWMFCRRKWKTVRWNGLIIFRQSLPIPRSSRICLSMSDTG